MLYQNKNHNGHYVISAKGKLVVAAIESQPHCIVTIYTHTLHQCLAKGTLPYRSMGVSCDPLSRVPIIALIWWFKK